VDVHRRQPVVTAAQALLREAAEELEQRVGVVRERGPQSQGRPVAEDDVEGLGDDGVHPWILAYRPTHPRS
jgi:hypothetical protein